MGPKEYTLPNGNSTTDVNKYVCAWKELAKPFEELSGLEAHSYNPGIAFISPKKRGNIVNFSVTQLLRINKNLKILKGN